MSLELRSVGFGVDGMSFEYIDFSGDVRRNGMVKNHALLVPDDGNYHDELESIRQQLTSVLEGMLEDFDVAEPVQPSDPYEVEKPSPYDNPLERDLGPVQP